VEIEDEVIEDGSGPLIDGQMGVVAEGINEVGREGVAFDVG